MTIRIQDNPDCGADVNGAINTIGVKTPIAPVIFNAVKTFICNFIYPVGTIYMSADPADPGKKLGGTWASWGAGRVPVGVNASDADFSSAEKVGGDKAVTLTTAQMPNHNHETRIYKDIVGYGYLSCGLGSDVTSIVDWYCNDHHSTYYTGSGQAHNNLQPYITCYMWKRVGGLNDKNTDDGLSIS